MLQRLFTAAACLAVLTTYAIAQDVRVEASLTDSAVWVGDQTVLEIKVYNADAPTEPQPPQITGVDVERTQAGFQTSTFQLTFNGRSVTKQYVSFAFSLTPQRAGEFVVPPIPVTVDGKQYTSQPLRLVAQQPPTDPDFELEFSIETSTAYVGQPVHARVSWFVAGNADRFAFSASAVPESFEVVAIPPPGSAQSDRFQIRAFGTTVVAVRQDVVRNGVQHPMLVFDVMLIPRRAGEFEVGPAQVVFNRIIDRLRSRRISRSNTPTLRVLPLPSDGRPADFTGLVGKFSIDADASPTDVNVGDPIALAIDIHGPEPLTGIIPPDLALDPAISESFKPSPDGWEAQPQSRAGQRRFETTIRARTSEIHAIPAIRLSYFDPETGEYRYAQSEPIDLNVRQTRQVTAADAIMGPGRAPSVTRDPLERAGDGAWALETDPDRLLASDSFALAQIVRSPVVISAVTLPPLAYAAASVLLIARRRRDPEQAKRHGAAARSRRLLRAGKAPAGVRAWVTSLTGQDEESVTAEDVRTLADTPEASLLGDVLEQDEWGRYTTGDGRTPTDASVAELRRAIRTIEQALARGRRRS